jgi:endonuclease/exonuclease/phosphatase family metal-dependent hydrolase
MLVALYGAIATAQQPAAPRLLSFDDLVRLYEIDTPPADLQNRLDQLLNTPFVNNSARNARPLKPNFPNSGRSIRVASWNIERGLEFDAIKAAFLNDRQFFRGLQRRGAANAKIDLAAVLREAAELKQADVIVLNEVDWGVKRTDYRNVAKDLAAALGMNYAYGVEFVEVDPLTLGTETFDEESAQNQAEFARNNAVDKARTLGLHGNAILSRFDLENVRIVRFVNQGHDWYADEKKGVSSLEKGKRKGANIVFQEKIAREVRRGGRMMLLADIRDAEIPGGIVTVVATHLEAKTKPVNRVKQLEELLSRLQAIDHPVVLAGDMNTSGSDASPTSFQREIKKRLGSTSFWATQGIKYATGVGLFYDITVGLIKSQRTRNDPTVTSVRFVSENPEAKFFTTLKNFRFADGHAFDFRGTKQYAIGGSQDTLSDSNERASKGFVSTSELTGRFTVTFKLDWIFVKPSALDDPDDREATYTFAPRFGRTLKALNYSLKDRISDHSPIYVDLPIPHITP